jgi:hypothetical protein
MSGAVATTSAATARLTAVAHTPATIAIAWIAAVAHTPTSVPIARNRADTDTAAAQSTARITAGTDTATTVPTARITAAVAHDKLKRRINANPWPADFLRRVKGRAATAKRKTALLKIPLLKITRPFMDGNTADQKFKVPQVRKNFNPTSRPCNHIHAS